MINNAAGGRSSFQLTPEGIESQFATSHVGPFFFTNLIVPKILATGSATYIPRVVFVASKAHAYHKGIDFADIEKPDPAKHSGFNTYSITKSANILTAAELSRKSKGKILGLSIHPGSEQLIPFSTPVTQNTSKI